MRKLLLGLIIIFSLNVAHASFVPVDSAKVVVENAANIKKQQDLVIMKMVSEMSVKNYEIMTGKKRDLINKLSFKILKYTFPKQNPEDTNGTRFNIGGFLLGFSLGLFGVLISFFSKDRNFRKWALIGFGFLSLILVIVILAALDAAL